jgi:hypothetical protein
LTTAQLFKLGIGIAVFVSLMVVRAETEDMWIRALITGAAFSILAWSVIQAKRK